MTKAELRRYHAANSGPSPRHVWKQIDQGRVARCDRCGSCYSYAGGGTAAPGCYVSPEWLREHPDDDRKVR